MLFDKKQITVANSVIELINRRRRQILVHSYLYYELNTNLIQDHIFDKWCRELVQLHSKYPTESKRAVFSSVFIGWTGFSGYDLLSKDESVKNWAKCKSQQLLK